MTLRCPEYIKEAKMSWINDLQSHTQMQQICQIYYNNVVKTPGLYDFWFV